uniref:Putative secreted protein n=1 Tax=Anopheles darlingi TaxID=43151 RepID=A0A2M4D3F9_ANODA
MFFCMCGSWYLVLCLLYGFLIVASRLYNLEFDFNATLTTHSVLHNTFHRTLYLYIRNRNVQRSDGSSSFLLWYTLCWAGVTDRVDGVWWMIL